MQSYSETMKALILMFILIACVLRNAASPHVPPSARPIPGNAQPAIPCARPEYEMFSILVGQWKVRWKDRVAPGAYAETEAIAQIEEDPAGCVLVEHFNGTRQQQRYSAISLISFASKEHLQQVWEDSAHG